uniref:HSF-type DNA-binding domain-containing protein n=1 Tax=Falco tinnunculus TaxID=100819 RepID=A0A8C4XM10_FALTI
MSPLCSTGTTMPCRNICWDPQPASASWPLLADWQDRGLALHGGGHRGKLGTKAMEREVSAQVTPSLPAPEELGQWADMTCAGPPGQGESAPRDAAMQVVGEERHVQAGGDGHDTKQVPPASSKSVGQGSGLLSLRFPQKLWTMVESDQFRSIWWSKGGEYVAINEKLFKEEVLGGGGPLQVYTRQSMKSFLRQMNYHGFVKMQGDGERSASLPEFLAEEAAASAHSKVLYYYNPLFKRGHPHLLEKCRRRAGLKRKALEMDEGQPCRRPGGQPAGDMPASTKRWAEAPPSLGATRPPPPAAAPALPEPAGAAGSKNFSPVAPSSPPPLSALPESPAPLCRQSPPVPHCPTCTCHLRTADAIGPQRGTI